jgi:hypothetical protein
MNMDLEQLYQSFEEAEQEPTACYTQPPQRNPMTGGRC